MPASLPAPAPSDEFLPALLDLSVGGVVCYAPLLSGTAEVVDFAFAYPNLAARPTSHREEFPAEPANQPACARWGRTQQQAVGAPLFELLPEAVGQGYEELLPQVLTTGEPPVATRMPSTTDRQGRRDVVHWNFVYLPLREANGRVTGVVVVATKGSAQVQAHRLAQALNDQRAAAQSAAARAQWARATAEHQRARLARLIAEVPAAMCVLLNSTCSTRFTPRANRFRAKNAGGTITVQSELGVGSPFIASLPPA